MKENKLFRTLRDFVSLFLAHVCLTGLMLLIFWLTGHWSGKVLYGGLLGAGVSMVSFLLLVLSALRAETAESPVKGQLAMRGSFLLRSLGMLAILVIALRSGRFDPIATLLPLCLMRLALFAPQLFRKKGEPTK